MGLSYLGFLGINEAHNFQFSIIIILAECTLDTKNPVPRSNKIIWKI